MVNSSPKNEKLGFCQSQVCYLNTTHLDARKLDPLLVLNLKV